MTIKKTIKVKPTGSPAAASAAGAPAAGGATIADRFRLDAPDPKAQKRAAGKGTTYTVIAGLIALAIAGVLTYTLYKHWDFLMPA